MPANPALVGDDLAALVDYLMLRDRACAATPAKAERPRYGSTGYPRFLDNEGYSAIKPPWGTLNCLDLNSVSNCFGKFRWANTRN